jgi:HK97 family phage prohead protease
MKMEYRKAGEIRATTEEGIVDAYLTAWDTVDSYTTSFQRGCFKRTFEERGHKIRLIWNHERLAGKVLECREDDYGPFVRVQFNLDTQAGKESFAHVRAGDVDSFSFGFNVIDDDIINKVRTFTEVKVMECGPVIFEANGAAKITDARAEDFEQTVKDDEVARRGWKLLFALEDTISDIYWNYDNNSEAVMGKIDMAISDFHGAYMAWLSEYYVHFGSRAATHKQLTRTGNIIQEALKSADSIENITRETSLTDSDLDKLKDGKLLTTEARTKLSELPDNIREAHQAQRRDTVETLCSEIRESGFNEAEKQRFTALLGLKEPESDVDDWDAALLKTLI